MLGYIAWCYHKMSIETGVTVYTLIVKAQQVVTWINSRLDQLKLSDDLATRIKDKLEYLQTTIKKIEPHLKKDGDTEEIKQFLTHLEKAHQSCTEISAKPAINKLATSAPADISKLHSIEAELERATSKLQLFITSSHLAEFYSIADFQNQILVRISSLQENSNAGVHIVQDRSVKPPSAPHGLAIQGDKNKLILSWEPSEGIVDEYEVCYDEHKECTIPVGTTTIVELESPKVQPGNVYAMKVRGINKGGKGEWSDVVIGQITKLPPQKPEISNLLLRSTMAVFTIKVAEAICSTESPVTCVRVSYGSTASTNFTNCEFTIQPGNVTYTFNVSGLQPDSRYKFTAKSKNAEGWSKPSNLKEDNTLSLPALPAKPNPPAIKICNPTTVKLVAVAPENTCSIKSPIVAWKVSGYSQSNEKVDKYYPQDEIDFTEESSTLDMADLRPNQQYTLQLLARNENGWSEPSEAFKIHIAVPSPPENVRVSSNRAHSLIKIRWNAPASADAMLVTHYEIVKTTRKGNYGKTPIVVPGIKFSATFTKLNQRTQYYFKVRTCNDLYKSAWSNEIGANTRIHKGIKAAFSPLVWAFGTVTAPFSASVGAGGLVYVGKTMNDGGSNKVTLTAGTAAGAVGGTVIGTLTAPVVGGAMAHYFVHGMDALSDQSDDEDAVIIEDNEST